MNANQQRGNVLREDEIREGMLFQSTGANHTLRGTRELVVRSVHPRTMQATVRNVHTGRGWRTSLFTLANPNRWEYTGMTALESNQ